MRLLNHYYTRCTELETENSWEENDREKYISFEAVTKNSRMLRGSQFHRRR